MIWRRCETVVRQWALQMLHQRHALRQAESGSPVADVDRQLGISEVRYCVWKN
jgi:hypothetical protein